MKVLVTGGTGFLGKRLVQKLEADSRVTRITVPSRKKRSHPSPRVNILPLDLTDPGKMERLELEVDAVIHLAGLYDFRASRAQNYLNNVVATEELVHWVEKNHPQSRFLYSSTYAVGQGVEGDFGEEPLTRMPDRRLAYSHCKAIAEKVVYHCRVRGAIFRLGILVGDSQTGSIDKIDGPYYLLDLLRRVGRFPRIAKTLSHFPVLMKPGVLPLVPVDTVVDIFHQALFREDVVESPAKIYGLFPAEGTSVEELTQKMVQRYLPETRVLKIGRVPMPVLNLFEKLTGIPKNVFEYSLRPLRLTNPFFQKTFGSESIPAFKEYEQRFIRGYEEFVSGGSL